MGETTDQIERHIQETRNDLSDNFGELEEKVKSAVDWRAQVAEHPGTMLAVAFGGGVLLSALLPSGRPSRRTTSEARRNAPPAQDAARHSNPAFDDKANGALGSLDTLKSALIGLAATKLSGFIEDLLPGFKEEVTEAQRSRRVDRSDSSGSGQPNWQKSTAAGAD
jgi:hypothetical protein